MRRPWLGVLATAAVLSLGVAACGGDDDGGDRRAQVQPPGGLKPLERLGQGEGELDLIAWREYVEDGSGDQADWVSGFEEETGCRVAVEVADSSDEMVTLMRTGRYDGVSASGDATLRLIAGGEVAPLNTRLISNYGDVFESLKNRPHNSVHGRPYGVPQGRGANLLMWNKDEIPGSVNSWSSVFDPAQTEVYKGKVTAYDNPMYIADAAVYLMSAQPELGIANPYELDERQFQAVIDLLRTQREYLGEYWSDHTRDTAPFSQDDFVVGTTWQVIADLLQAGPDPAPIETVLPREGATGWSDTWMIHSEARHPNCMYLWMNHMISPETNAAVAEWVGAAPSNQKACDHTEDPEHCDAFHANDEAYFDEVHLWTTPTRECGDDRGAVCKDYSEWAAAWSDVKGQAAR